jgi:hypothetical protein
MIDDGAPHPVELLRDRHGVYGIGVSELFDFELTAARAGVELERPPDLILRPDWFPDNRPRCAVLQKILGGMGSHEERLWQFIHHEALNRSRLPWPPQRLSLGETARVWWSADKQKQTRNRGIYQLSLHVINHLIGRALEEAADADAVKAARRFTFEHREHIYRAAALSRRALQLTETFPVLALAIYSEHWRARQYGEPLVMPHDIEILCQSWDAENAELSSRKNEAVHLVDRGARLRDVAGVMNIPMALRHIKPGVAHLANKVFCQHPDLLAFIPATTPRQHIWLPLVHWACTIGDADFGAWAARHVLEIPGCTLRVGSSFLSDIADWACRKTGREFITRPFTPSMSLKTTIELSADWHEAVTNNLAEGPNATFPTPWYPPARLGDYEILPIEDAATLCSEGHAMHHCAGTYSEAVLAGELYVYSIRRNGERTATLALQRCNNRATINQLRGACNREPPKAITAMVLCWLRAQQPLPMRQESEGRRK